MDAPLSFSSAAIRYSEAETDDGNATYGEDVQPVSIGSMAFAGGSVYHQYTGQPTETYGDDVKPVSIGSMAFGPGMTGQPTDTFDNSDAAPSIGYMGHGMGYSQTTGGNFRHDALPSRDDVRRRDASHTGGHWKLSHLISNENEKRVQEIDLQTILEATHGFSDDHRIGIGGFGSVYHATLPDGRKVAVKRAEESGGSRYPGGVINGHSQNKKNQFINELKLLPQINHKNLVRLLGFCEENDELVLVYEYMENGSLHDQLYNLSPSYVMSWPVLIKVALDVARGLEYLHVYTEPLIIHHDIKTSNILLDVNWNGKVSDFGLSLIAPLEHELHLSFLAGGTIGYIDPEYYRLQQLTTKIDVYSFGVVLLELLYGQPAIHKNNRGVLMNVVDSAVPYIISDDIHRILNPKVAPPTAFQIDSVVYVAYLAADCVALDGVNRPTMSHVVTCLERALAACLETPLLSDGSSSSSP